MAERGSMLAEAHSLRATGPTERDPGDLLSVLDDLDETLGHVAGILEESRTGNRAFRSRIANGMTVREAFGSISAPEGRSQVDDALKALQELRHRSRCAIFAAGRAQGLSIGELSRMYGFSRQLGMRFAREAPGG
jgi:hypothetical protein